MKVVVYSKSAVFTQFLTGHLENPDLKFSRQMDAPRIQGDIVYLLHCSGRESECREWLMRHVSEKSITVGICADRPDIREMLECVRQGAKAYCNSHMAAIHYRQMLRLLAAGQSWFPPQMLDATFKLAHQAVTAPGNANSLDMLTNREREIALVVAEGKSNRSIAEQLNISEPTVKTHLSNIFKKLDIKDRIGLVLLLKQA